MIGQGYGLSIELQALRLDSRRAELRGSISAPDLGRSPRVMVLTARMGAGHDRVASELARRLRGCGAVVQVVDVWDLQPAGVGRLVTAFYHSIIRRAPSAYQAIYRTWLKPPPSRRKAPISPVTRLAARRLRAKAEAFEADLVVSVFHLGTQMLGQLRRRGEISIPTASVCVDFAAHGLWVDPDVDMNLVWAEVPAARLREQGARGVRRAAPAVAPQFRARKPASLPGYRSFGLNDELPVVLVVGGSWGAGEVVSTVNDLRVSDRWQVVVAAGTNQGLRRRLEAVGVRALGWVEDMAGLLATADVVVENAGGLTAMEAAAVGVPVVSYRPIPGHGRDNVAAMDRSGMSFYARNRSELMAVVRELTAGPTAPGCPGRRSELVEAGTRLFSAPAPEDLLLRLAA